MGIYSDYLNQPLARDFTLLTAERKRQLQRVSKARGGRDILVFAADVGKAVPGVSIEYADLAPLNDLLSGLKGSKLDLILETPGGSGEVVEDLVRLFHSRYEEVAVIVPGWAKSAGTLLTMAADEILMGPTSALGPIDAQLFWQGKRFSADALLEAFEKIKEEVEKTGSLNKAYVPMLQGISPGELQSAQNALDFAKRVTRDWLVKYKFKNWDVHHTDQAKLGQPVTPEEKEQRADEIATKLGDHRSWLTHGRSLNMQDLTTMRLVITDFTKDPELADAITRYHALMQISFSSTNCYKIIETEQAQVLRFASPSVPAPQILGLPKQAMPLNAQPARAEFQVNCPCGQRSQVQANFDSGQPLQAGRIPFPADDIVVCSSCGRKHDLKSTRLQLEAQTGKKIQAN